MKLTRAVIVTLILTMALRLVGCTTISPPPPTPVPTPTPSPLPTPSTPSPAPAPQQTPCRPPLPIGETMHSHDFAFTPTEVGYTNILINGPFKGNTFDAFKPIKGYKFFYLKMSSKTRESKGQVHPCMEGMPSLR